MKMHLLMAVQLFVSYLTKTAIKTYTLRISQCVVKLNCIRRTKNKIYNIPL